MSASKKVVSEGGHSEKLVVDAPGAGGTDVVE